MGGLTTRARPCPVAFLLVSDCARPGCTHRIPGRLAAPSLTLPHCPAASPLAFAAPLAFARRRGPSPGAAAAGSGGSWSARREAEAQAGGDDTDTTTTFSRAAYNYIYAIYY